MNKNAGFTLIEVMIAVLLLAGGMLGMASLQATSIADNRNALNRSQATALASDMADRIRANYYATNRDPTVLAAYLANVETPNGDCSINTGCSPADMARNDLSDWNTTMATTLPSAIGTLTPNGSNIIITITWDEDHDGDNNNNPSFQTSFQP